MGRTNYTKNLSIMELSNIENYLNFDKSPSFIANLLGRNESTIRAEIRNYSSGLKHFFIIKNLLSIENAYFFCQILPKSIA